MKAKSKLTDTRGAVKIHCMVPWALWKALKEYADSQEVYVSAVVRQAIENFLKDARLWPLPDNRPGERPLFKD